jgi:hypothetical protein
LAKQNMLLTRSYTFSKTKHAVIKKLHHLSSIFSFCF